MDHVDAVIAERLRARIQTLLVGDATNHGLYYQATRQARCWDDVIRIRGEIMGLEMALIELEFILKQMSDAPTAGERVASLN